MNHGELLYGLTEDKFNNLEQYILSKGFANGTKFSTSGHSYDSDSQFHWATLGQPITYSKWHFRYQPPMECYLSLQLIDGELYMIRSWGYDPYYICEYRGFWRGAWIFINCRFVFIVSMILMCLVIFLISCRKKKLMSNVDDQETGISKTELYKVLSTNIIK